MAVIRVGVQAPQGSAGQVVDLDGPRASVASISNVSAESIAYSLDGGGSWTTLAAGASGGSGVIDAGMLRLRKVASTGAYPAPVDVDATIYGVAESSFSPGQVSALQGQVPAAGIQQVPRILHLSTDITTSSDTAAGTANALASFVLPAGIMGANGLLRFTFVCKGLDSLGAKNIRIWANSTQLFALASGSLNTNVLVQHQTLWFNGGSEGSQNTYYNQPTTYGTVSATIGNTGINTAIQQTIYLTADSATAAGPTVSKYLFMCELLRNQ